VLISKTLSKLNFSGYLASLLSLSLIWTVLSSSKSWQTVVPKAFYLSLRGLNLQTTLTLAAAGTIEAFSCVAITSLLIFEYKSIEINHNLI
jgi:hypothetical protein